MHRIDTSTAQIDKFGQGKNGFTNGDPATGRRATDLNSDMWDAVQEELCNVIEKSGLSLNKDQHDQLYRAIAGMITSKIPDALIRNKNLSDVADKNIALANLNGVPKTTTVNSRELSGNISITAQDIFNGQAASIGNAADLNSLQTAGLYYQAANAQAATGKNYPEAIAGSLEVYKHAGITQVYRVYNNSRAYIRTLYSGTWTAWTKQYDAANKPTADDVGALALTGGTLNGNLTVKNTIQIGSIGNAILNVGDTDSGLRSSKDGQVDLWANGKMFGYWNTTTLSFTGQIIPTNYTNFDARYQKINTASKAASGWYKDTNTGIIFQWGTVNRTNYATPVTFPIAFPSICVGVSATLRNYIDNISSSTFNIRAVNVSRTGFQYGSGGASENQAFWLAIGY
jgi:hypothetical protein